MKVALLSDIHGNLVALEKVIPELIDADRVVCLGDVASVGPQPRGTISFLRRARWPCVMGNTDESLATSRPEDYGHLDMPEDEKKKMVTLDRWTMGELDPSDIRFLAGFKPTVEVNDGHHPFLCYHGSPRSNTEQIRSTTPEEQLAEIFSGRSAKLYAGGHTHAQMVRKFGDSLVINPGSLGLPFVTGVDGRPRNPVWAEYAMVTSSSTELRVDLRRTRYNIRDLKEAAMSSGMPNPRWWLRDWV